MKPPSESVNLEELDDYPYIVQPKIDGIRCLLIKGYPYSSSGKPIRNRHVNMVLREWYKLRLWGSKIMFDGELVVGPTFQDTTSGIMSEHGKPRFIYHVFDCVQHDDYNMPYEDRLTIAERNIMFEDDYCVKVVRSLVICGDLTEQAVTQVLMPQLETKEGIIIRNPDGRYKCGRTTLKEDIIYKWKPFEDSEATVVGAEELMINGTPNDVGNFGLVEQKYRKEDLIPGNKLGSLVLQDKQWSKTFKCGSGFTDYQRKTWWPASKVLGKTIKYKFQREGIKDVPRQPVFLGFRDEEDK